jgi:hypothetical protein
MIKGSCICGVVAFEIRAPFRFFQYCYCSRCRKRSGSVHAANIALDAAQLTWIRGEDRIKRFELASAQRWSNAFCTECGSATPWRSRNGELYIVPSGALDEDPSVRPDRRIWLGSRAPWLIEPSSLPGFDEGPPPPR